MDTKLREAVREFTTKDFNTIGEKKALEILLNLATQYLALTKEDGVPEDINGFDFYSSEKEAMAFTEGYKHCYSLISSLLLKSRKECEELENKLFEQVGYSSGLKIEITKLQSTLFAKEKECEELKKHRERLTNENGDKLQKIWELQSTLAEKDKEIINYKHWRKTAVEYAHKLEIKLKKKDQRIAQLEQYQKCHDSELGVCRQHCEDIQILEAKIKRLEHSQAKVGKEELRTAIWKAIVFKCGIDTRQTDDLSSIASEAIHNLLVNKVSTLLPDNEHITIITNKKEE